MNYHENKFSDYKRIVQMSDRTTRAHSVIASPEYKEGDDALEAQSDPPLYKGISREGWSE